MLHARVGALLVGAGLCGCGTFESNPGEGGNDAGTDGVITGTVTPKLGVSTLGDGYVVQGKPTNVRVKIERTLVNAPVNVSFVGLPLGATSAVATIPPDATTKRPDGSTASPPTARMSTPAHCTILPSLAAGCNTRGSGFRFGH